MNLPDTHGYAPLHIAAQHGYIPDVKVLIEHGANPNPKDKTGRSPLHFAAQKGGHLQIAKVLLENGAAYNSCDDFGMSALMYAVEDIAFEVGMTLLDYGADINMSANNGNCPLHWAARYDVIKPAEILLGHGAKIDACNNWGETPLLIAIQENHLSMIGLFIREGARVDVLNASDRSILHCVAMYSNIETMHLLARARICGVDIDASDADGWTPRGLFWNLRNENYQLPQRAPFEEERDAFDALLASVNQPCVEELLDPNMDRQSGGEGAPSIAIAEDEPNSDSDIFLDAEERLESQM